MSGVQVLWGRPCLVLEPVRAFAFGQGVRAPTLGGVRPGDRLPERVDREWNPPQHVEVFLHVLITIEKHKMLPVFPGRSLDGGRERAFFGAGRLCKSIFWGGEAVKKNIFLGWGGCERAFFGAGRL